MSIVNYVSKLKKINGLSRADLRETEARKLLLEAWKDCDMLYVGLQLSSDPNWSSGLDKIVAIEDEFDDSGDLTFDEFLKIVDELSQKGRTQKEAKALVVDAAMRAKPKEWNLFYRRILQKKLQDDLPMDVLVQVLKELTGLPIVLGS